MVKLGGGTRKPGQKKYNRNQTGEHQLPEKKKKGEVITQSCIRLLAKHIEGGGELKGQEGKKASSQIRVVRLRRDKMAIKGNPGVKGGR